MKEQGDPPSVEERLARVERDLGAIRKKGHSRRPGAGQGLGRLPPISFRVTREQLRDLEAEAEATGVSIAAVVRERLWPTKGDAH